jgi:hypothetical protein
MARRRTALVLSAWLRFTKISVKDRLSLNVAQQRIAVADAQRAARSFELKHDAVQEDMDVLKREVARLNVLTTQRDRTIAALTDELEKEKRKFAIAASTAILLLQLLLTVLAFATQLLEKTFRQLRFVSSLVPLSNMHALPSGKRSHWRVLCQGITGAGTSEPGAG